MEWTNDLIFEFLTLYENEPALWNSSSPQHKNKNDVHDAWLRLKTNLKEGTIPIMELKKKKENLMSTYRKLKGKVKDSMTTGSGIDDIYKPEWPFYEMMAKFLDGVYKPKRTKTTMMVEFSLGYIFPDVITEAEQIVGYPTSFLNLRWLFNDEIANTAIHLRKLVGTNHPLLKSAKNLLIGSKSNLQSVGLIVLLVSKAAGFKTQDFTKDLYDSGVLHSQRALAEIVEMKRTGHLIHKTMANLQDKEKLGDKFKDLLYGNKIVLLTGDYLLATCLQHLGGLRNNEVTELISTGLRDLVEGDGDHDADNNPLSSKPKASNEVKKHYNWEDEDNLAKLGSNEFLGQGKDEWLLRTMLTSGSLLGKGCQGAMKLGKQEHLEKDAYKLGGHLAIIWQLYLDVKDFFTHPHSYSLVGAPVTLAIWEYPTIYSYIIEAKLEKTPVEYKQLYYAVRGTRSFEYLTKFLDEEMAAILKYSNKFPVEDARCAIQKMATTIHSETLQYIE